MSIYLFNVGFKSKIIDIEFGRHSILDWCIAFRTGAYLRILLFITYDNNNVFVFSQTLTYLALTIIKWINFCACVYFFLNHANTVRPIAMKVFHKAGWYTPGVTLTYSGIDFVPLQDVFRTYLPRCLYKWYILIINCYVFVTLKPKPI